MNCAKKALLIGVYLGLSWVAYANGAADENQSSWTTPTNSNKDIEIVVIDFPGNQTPKRQPKKKPDGMSDANWEAREKWSSAQSMDARRKARRESPENIARWAREDEGLRVVYRQIKTQGFALASDAWFEHKAKFAIQARDLKQPSDVVDRMGFDSAVFSGAIDIDTVRGVFVGPKPDGSIHTMTSLIESGPLQTTVTLEEEDLNNPGEGSGSTRIRVPKPELDVNGHPAILTVYKSKDGAKGWTSLMIFSDRILAELTVDKAIPQSDPLFDELMALAKQLY